MATFWKDMKDTARDYAGFLGFNIDVGGELKKDLQKMAAVSPESLRFIDSDRIIGALCDPLRPSPWPVVLARVFGLSLPREESGGHSVYVSAIRMVASRYGYETRILEIASQMSRQGLLKITGDVFELTASGEERGALNWEREMQARDDYENDPNFYVEGYGQIPYSHPGPLLDRIYRNKFGDDG